MLRPALPTWSSAQVEAEDLIPVALALRPCSLAIDLGCGRGNSVDVFRRAAPEVRWVGLELEDSEEYAQRTRTDAEFVVFDGVNLPFDDSSVDVVFTKQVLEHVERPEELMADVSRVVPPGGVLTGSTSQLEPYHGYSTANFTPYGLKRLLDRSSFELEAVMPGIDGPTLMTRRVLRSSTWFDRFWSNRSPWNALVDGVSRLAGWDAEDRNALKLLLSGHYCFIARRR